MVSFLYHSEPGTVARFQSPVGIAAIEGTRETVRPVLTDEGAVLGKILLHALNSDFVKIVGRRLNEVAYFLLLGINRKENDG
jgi:hypothetical protein